MARSGKKRKWKKQCCDKPLRKACKRCPRRREGAETGPRDRSERLPACIAELLRV